MNNEEPPQHNSPPPPPPARPRRPVGDPFSEPTANPYSTPQPETEAPSTEPTLGATEPEAAASEDSTSEIAVPDAVLTETAVAESTMWEATLAEPVSDVTAAMPPTQTAPYDVPLLAGDFGMSPPPPPPMAAPPRRRGWFWAIGALAAVVFIVGAFGLGRLTSDDGNGEDLPVPTTAIAAQAVETAEPAAVVVTPSALEPVADIAEAVAPSVVQLETLGGLGSGVLYTTDGYIMTAAHVIANSPDVLVRLATGEAVEGVVVGSDSFTDIAVVKIPGNNHPAAELAIGADIRVGSLAVALGSPFGLDQTVTAGIVSAVDRDVNRVSMVQTDAAINPGNSGGPLVDAQGRVIGINDQIFTRSGDNAGIGFAVSIDLAKIVADQLVAGEDVRLAFLGVSTQASFGDRPGAVVQEVVAGSAAESSGLEIGDIIVAVNGTTITDPQRLRSLVISTPPGTTVDIDVFRDGEPLTISAQLGQGE